MDAWSKHGTRRAAKVGHRKSRNGCTKCKTRRVKCDETRPICSNCQRLHLPCAWPGPDSLSAAASPAALDKSPAFLPATATRAPFRAMLRSQAGPQASLSTASVSSADVGDASASSQSRSQSSQDEAQGFSAMLQLWSGHAGHEEADDAHATPTATAAEDDCLLPESRARRLLEHRLMQHYLFHLGIPFPMSPSQDSNDLWTKLVPPLALRCDNVLYAVLAQSATHLLRREPGNRELFHARQAYLVAAMRVQRRMVETLTLDSAEAVCLASVIMLVLSFAMLDERVVDVDAGTETDMEAYAPPVDWLRLGKGAGAVVWASMDAILKTGDQQPPQQHTTSAILAFAHSPPRLLFDESYFDAANRGRLSSLLTQDLPSGDDWADAETRDAYEKMLAYVGSLRMAMHRGEPIYVLCRRVQGFTMVMRPRFIDFVAERRPRALVILAHFFAAVHKISGAGVWWLGGEDGKESIAKREIRGIRSIVPPEWMGHLVWPIEAAGLS